MDQMHWATKGAHRQACMAPRGQELIARIEECCIPPGEEPKMNRDYVNRRSVLGASSPVVGSIGEDEGSSGSLAREILGEDGLPISKCGTAVSSLMVATLGHDGTKYDPSGKVIEEAGSKYKYQGLYNPFMYAIVADDKDPRFAPYEQDLKKTV
jgi:hypothetical protein